MGRFALGWPQERLPGDGWGGAARRFGGEPPFSCDGSGTDCLDPNQSGMRSKLAILLVGVAACVAAVVGGLSRSEPATFSISTPYLVANDGAQSTALSAQFTVTNKGAKSALLEVSAVETKTPSGWGDDTQLTVPQEMAFLRTIRGNSTATFSGDFQDFHQRTRFRLMVLPEGSIFLMGRTAVSRLWERFARGNQQITNFWIPNQYSSGYEIVTPEIEQRKNLIPAGNLAEESPRHPSRGGLPVPVPPNPDAR